MDTKWTAILALLGACAVGCWDTPEHEYDTQVTVVGDTSTAEPLVGFGAPCETHEDCQAFGYPLEARCIHNVLGLISTPGGYCTACCDQVAVGGCYPGIDCVGADQVYTICVATCQSDTDCRQSEGYECRPIYYIADQFPGRDYCLPTPELAEVDSDEEATDPECPWPWKGI